MALLGSLPLEIELSVGFSHIMSKLIILVFTDIKLFSVSSYGILICFHFYIPLYFPNIMSLGLLSFFLDSCTNFGQFLVFLESLLFFLFHSVFVLLSISFLKVYWDFFILLPLVLFSFFSDVLTWVSKRPYSHYFILSHLLI